MTSVTSNSMTTDRASSAMPLRALGWSRGRGHPHGRARLRAVAGPCGSGRCRADVVGSLDASFGRGQRRRVQAVGCDRRRRARRSRRGPRRSRGTSVIRVAQHAPGGSWTTLPGDISSSLPGDGCSPFASIDPAGNALVVVDPVGRARLRRRQPDDPLRDARGEAASWSGPGVIGPAATPGTGRPSRPGTPRVRWSSPGRPRRDEQVHLRGGREPDDRVHSAAKLTTSPLTDADSLYYLAVAIGPPTMPRRCSGQPARHDEQHLHLLPPSRRGVPRDQQRLRRTAAAQAPRRAARDRHGRRRGVGIRGVRRHDESFASRIQPAMNSAWRRPRPSRSRRRDTRRAGSRSASTTAATRPPPGSRRTSPRRTRIPGACSRRCDRPGSPGHGSARHRSPMC